MQEASLMCKPVWVIDVNILHVEVGELFADDHLKVKCRAGGVMQLKSKACRQDSDQRFIFDTHGSFILEDDHSLAFELCRERRVLSSQMLARGEVPLLEVQCAEAQSNKGKVVCLQLHDLQSHEKVLAKLVVNLHIKNTSLEAAGGTKALKLLNVPQKPAYQNDQSAFSLSSDLRQGSEYIKSLAAAELALHKVFEAARPPRAFGRASL